MDRDFPRSIYCVALMCSTAAEYGLSAEANGHHDSQVIFTGAIPVLGDPAFACSLGSASFKPSIDAQPALTWLSYERGPGGEPLWEAPVSETFGL